jgi:hypothetical protein
MTGFAMRRGGLPVRTSRMYTAYRPLQELGKRFFFEKQDFAWLEIEQLQAFSMVMHKFNH